MKSLLSLLPFFRTSPADRPGANTQRPQAAMPPVPPGGTPGEFVARQSITWEKAAILMNLVIAQGIRKHHKSLSWGDRLLTLDKSMGFMSDPVLQRCFSDFNGKHAYDQYMGPHGIAWRLNTLLWAGRRGLRLDGDFVECGVFKGDMAWVLVNCLDFAQVDKTFYLYDTFAGFAPAYSSEADFVLSPSLFAAIDEAYKIPFLYEQVCARFASYANVRVVRGTCPDILESISPKRIAFLHIDLNSSAAEVGVLEKLFDRVVPGGAIIFDDYGWIDFSRQKVAEDAFMAARDLEILELPTGQGLVIKP